MNHTYTDVIIDLETLGDTPDSIPVQMGVAFFDLHDRRTPITGGERDICAISCAELGLIQTRDTHDWWRRKGLPIPSMLPAPIELVLAKFTDAFDAHANAHTRVWSRGNSFDLAILKIAYRRLGMKFPWAFWNEADVRTYLLAMTGVTKGRSNSHSALADALNGIQDLHDAAANHAVLDITFPSAFRHDLARTYEPVTAPLNALAL